MVSACFRVSGTTFKFANMSSLAILVHSFEFVFIGKPRAISIICPSYLTLNPVAIKG